MKLVAIGASAGGPAALAEVLGSLPSDFSAAVVVVQHVDQRMAQGMADWLTLQSKIPVRVAVEGDRPLVGTVLLAATNDHLVLKTPDRLGYSPAPPPPGPSPSPTRTAAGASSRASKPKHNLRGLTL